MSRQRVEGLLWPITRRRAVAGMMIIFGLSRLGLIQFNFLTAAVPTPLWGVALLTLGLALWLSRCCTVYGVVISALCVGALVGFGLDVGPNNTTAVLVYWLSFVAAIETGAVRE